MASDLPAVAVQDAGIRSAAALRLLDRLESAGLDPHSLIVARHGRVALRCAWAPYRTDRPSLVYSVSKTVTALAVGLLVADGRLAVDDPVDRHLHLPNPSGLTIAHLLTMTTGHSRAQTLAMPLDAATLLATPPEHAPGTFFAYNSPASLTLSEVVTAVTGARLGDLLATRVYAPLGIGPRWWTPHGRADQGYSGLHLTTDDLARICVMLAAGGRFGPTQVIPRTWVDAMLTVRTSTSEHDAQNPDYGSGYGYQVWRSRHGFRADGSYGQFGIVIPERGLAIAYQGATRDQQAPLTALFDFVDELGDDPLPTDPDGPALAERIATLDAWTAVDSLRAPLSIDRDPPAPSDWSLDAAGLGWTILTPAGALPFTEHSWTSTDLERSGRVLRLWVRGRRHADGHVSAEIAHENSPHRLVAIGAPGSPLRTAWRTAPLWQVTLDALAVPVDPA